MTSVRARCDHIRPTKVSKVMVCRETLPRKAVRVRAEPDAVDHERPSDFIDRKRREAVRQRTNRGNNNEYNNI
jgi:hypothetical protein